MTAINRSSAAAARLQNVTSVTAAGRPAVTAVRALLWVLLWFNAWLPLRGFLSLPLVFGFLLFSLALGVWGYRLRLRFWCLLAVGVLFPLIVRGAAGIAGILLFHDPVGAPGESLPAILDRNILILILPSMITAGSIYWGIRDERWVLPEILLQGAFLIPLFYDQGEFRMNRFAHPILFAAVVAAMLFVHIAVLLFHSREGEKGAPTADRPRGGVGSGTALTGGSQTDLSGDGRPKAGRLPRNRPPRDHVPRRQRPEGAPRDRPFPLIPAAAALLLILLLTLIYFGWIGKSAPARGGLMEPTLFSFDFSRYVSLETEISVKDDLLLLMKKEGPAETMLIRRFILSGYKPDKGFYMTNGPGEAEPLVAVPPAETIIPVPDQTGRGETVQEYYLVNIDSASLLGMNEPERILPYALPSGSSFSAIYTVKSLVPRFEPWELSETDPPRMDGELFRFYTRYGNDDRIGELAAEITRGLDGYYDRVKAVERYLKNEYWYSQRPGAAPDGNQLHYFLFESRKGYCSYFAFSMTLLLRSLGIPARVVVGFWADPETELLSVYPIRADMAHAWVEVYFGPYGWIEFDPTSERVAPGEEYQISQVRMEEFEGFIREIIENRDRLVPMLPPEGGAFTGGDAGRRGIDILIDAFRGWWFVILPVLYLVAIVLLRLSPLIAAAVGTAGRTAGGAGGKGAGGAGRAADPRRRVRLRFLWLYRILCSLGKRKDRGESVLEYCARLDRDHDLGLNALCGWYLKAVFSDSFTEEDMAAFSGSAARAGGLIRRRFGTARVIVWFLLPRGILRRLP